MVDLFLLRMPASGDMADIYYDHKYSNGSIRHERIDPLVYGFWIKISTVKVGVNCHRNFISLFLILCLLIALGR